ncbi:MAG: hypothetical protein ACXWW9_06820 [Actinomycetota bacterium]
MRPATAMRIAVAIGIVWAATALVMFVSGDPEAIGLTRQLFAVVITVGGIVWLGYRFRVLPHRQSFEGQAKDAGLRAQAGDPFGLLASPFELFHRAATARDLENTAWGLRRGQEIVVVDYWFTPDSNPSRDDYRRFVCVIDAPRPEWSDISVVPASGGSIVRDAVGLDDVDLESERFNRAFEVRAADRAFASAFLGARMMEWLLLEPPGVAFEVVAGRLMVFGPRPQTSIDDVSRGLQRFDAFLDHVPPVLSSLFPAPGLVSTAIPPDRPDR